MDTIVASVFGSSWKSSLFGLLGGVIYYFSQAGVAIPTSWAEAKTALVAAGIYAWGRVQKDHDQTGVATK